MVYVIALALGQFGCNNDFKNSGVCWLLLTAFGTLKKENGRIPADNYSLRHAVKARRLSGNIHKDFHFLQLEGSLFLKS